MSPYVWYYSKKGNHLSRRAQIARDERRSYGVSAYIGANGGGKTFCMVWDTLPSLEAGRPALSTVRLQDYENPRPCDDDWCASNPDVLDHNRMRPTAEGRQAMIRNARALFFEGPHAVLEEVEMVSHGVHLAAHPLWVPWTGWEQLLQFRFGEVLADEMTGIAEARGAMSLPALVIDQFQQLRRDDIPFRYTMPSWERADVSLRQPTQVVTLCAGKMSTQAPADAGMDRMWRPKRYAEWRTYEAMQLTDLSEGKRTELVPEVKDRHWFPESPVFTAYDTFAPVLRVGHASESGRCHKCGGSRKAPVCACGPTPPRAGAGRRVLGAGTPASAEREDVPPARTRRPAPPREGRRAARPVSPVSGDTPGRVGEPAPIP